MIEEDLGTTCATAAEDGGKGRKKKEGWREWIRKVSKEESVRVRMSECLGYRSGWPTDTAKGRSVEEEEQ